MNNSVFLVWRKIKGTSYYKFWKNRFPPEPVRYCLPVRIFSWSGKSRYDPEKVRFRDQTEMTSVIEFAVDRSGIIDEINVDFRSWCRRTWIIHTVNDDPGPYFIDGSEAGSWIIYSFLGDSFEFIIISVKVVFLIWIFVIIHMNESKILRDISLDELHVILELPVPPFILMWPAFNLIYQSSSFLKNNISQW